MANKPETTTGPSLPASQIINKGKQKNTASEDITTIRSSSHLFNPQMEVDFSFTPTEDPAIQDIIFSHKTNTSWQTAHLFRKHHKAERSFNSSDRRSPVGFSSETEESAPEDASDQEEKSNMRVNMKLPRPAHNKPPTDWQVEYGRKRYKMIIEATKLPGNNDNQKIRSIGQALAKLESLTSTKLITQQGTKMIVALFGTQRDAEKAKNLMLADGCTIHMQEARLYNAAEAKYNTIRAWDIPLNTKPEEIKAAFSKYGEINNIRINTIGMWQSANIEYTNQDSYQELVQKWAIPFKGELI
jgi:hypothetical protein